MSYLQQLLNKRLGIQEDFIEQKKNLAYIHDRQLNIKNKLDTRAVSYTPCVTSEEPVKEEPVKEEPVKEEPIKEEIKQPIKIKNERGAGRKKMNDIEKDKRKQLIIKKLSSSKDDEDIETISNIKNNSNKIEIQQEINNTKKRLQLLKDSLIFSD